MPTPEPREDRVHRPRDEHGWRESYYFSFFDERHGLGGFSSIGRRPASGHTGSINVLWGPDRPTLAATEYDHADRHDDEHLVKGLRYRCAEPLGPWALTFAGQLNDGGSSVEVDRAALAPAERATVDRTDVRYSLTFSPEVPAYLYEEAKHWRRLFDGHVDEVGRVTGTIEIDGETFAIDARGAKDHSWGVRDWYGVQAWRWMDVVSRDGLEAAFWRGSFDDVQWFGDGAIYGDGTTTPIDAYEEAIETVPRERKEQPERVRIELGAGDRSLSLTGDVVRIVPILFSRERDGTRDVSWNDRALVRCTDAAGATAWANVEFEALLREPVETGG